MALSSRSMRGFLMNRNDFMKNNGVMHHVISYSRIRSVELQLISDMVRQVGTGSHPCGNWDYRYITVVNISFAMIKFTVGDTIQEMVVI